MRLVPIPGGEFDMGSDDGSDDEKPKHRVGISPFHLAATEVTRKQYREVMKTDPSDFKAEAAVTSTDNLPVVNVSWLDAIAFCNA